MLLWLATLSTICAVAASAATPGSKIPSWLQPCYRDDLQFDKCATEHGQNAIAGLVKGDRKIRLPPMDPLQILEMKLDSSVTHLGLDFIMRNISVYGLSNAVVTGFHADFEQHTYAPRAYLPSLEIVGWYSISGQVLVLPITGSGRGNITLKDVNTEIKLECALEKNPRDGKDYIQAKRNSLTFNTTRGHFYLENLFNGDKVIGATMNRFLNDNWKQLVASVGPIISEALGDFLQQIFNTVFDILPYDEILPKKPE